MAEKKMSTGKIIGIIIGGLALLFVFSGGCFVLGLLSGSLSDTSGYRQGNIYEINIEGVITGTEQSGILGGGATTPKEVIAQLDIAEKSNNIKAILLRVNSPGGSPAASQEIYQELKKAEKPVVVSVSDTCASGAYYISCAADRIIANPASSVGSIGVVMQVPNLEGLYDKLGIEYTTIKQGKYKDMGNTSREITGEEKKLLEEQTKKIYEQFISDVAESREISKDKVKELATGWVYLGSEAVGLELIDELGTYKDAINVAAELGGVVDEPMVVSAQEFSFYDILLQYYLGGILSRLKLFNYLY
ncbi:MAG: signal peptide peptidase SppA [Candidatus Humimicrobiaceae bacterium]